MRGKNCNIIHLQEVSSTNSYAKKLLKDQRPPEGTVVVADHQTAGKGQDGNSWESEAGKNILMTLILYPAFIEISSQFRISMAVALGIIDFLNEILPDQRILIKWPNDIYVEKRKIGGILINNEIMGDHFEHVIAGIGLNVNQLAFSSDIPNPVSLKAITGQEYSVKDVTLRLCDCVMNRYEQLKQESFNEIETDYLNCLLGLNEWREYIYQGKTITARITGVNEFGRLILETDEGQIECDLKEIVYLF